MSEKKFLLAVHLTDKDDTKYKYSDELFDWFFDRVKFISYNASVAIFEPADIDLKGTKDDLSIGGCRIYDKDHQYIKLYDGNILLLEFDESEMEQMQKHDLDLELTLSEIVDYYYSTLTTKI